MYTTDVLNQRELEDESGKKGLMPKGGEIRNILGKINRRYGNGGE